MAELVYGARLELVCTLIAYRGFESLSFRQIFYEKAVDDFTFTAFLCIKNKKHKKIDSLTGFTHHQGIYFSFINLSTADLLMSYCVTYQTETVHLLKSASVAVRVAFE